MRTDIIWLIRDRRERESAGDRDPWTWSDVAAICAAAGAGADTWCIADAFIDGNDERVRRELTDYIIGQFGPLVDFDLLEYVRKATWVLPE